MFKKKNTVCFILIIAILNVFIGSVYAAGTPSWDDLVINEGEPNNSQNLATSIHGINDIIHAKMDKPSDIDYFKFISDYTGDLLVYIESSDHNIRIQQRYDRYNDGNGIWVANDEGGTIISFAARKGCVYYFRVQCMIPYISNARYSIHFEKD